MRFKNIIWFSLILILLVSGCQLSANSNVEIVVQENNLSYWYLSPSGDYIIYGAPRGKGNFLLDLSTGQKHEFDCRLHWWDSYHFECSQSFELSVIDAKTLIETSLTPINLTKNPEVNINELLAEAEVIYQPEWITDTIYILASDYQSNPKKNYVISGITNISEVLKNYTYKFIPADRPRDQRHKQTSSPNGLYYYDFIIDGFAIFNTDNNEIVAKFIPEETGHFEIRGWAVDSSGVYFTNYLIGFVGPGKPKTIRKLKIPDN